MKNNYIILFVCILLCCIACGEVDDPEMKCPVVPVEGFDDNIIGKWKLVRGESVFHPDGPIIEDYSCNNIIYHFQQDGILSISSDIEDHIGSFGDGHPYELVEDTVFNFYEYSLKIESLSYWFSLNEGIMELDSRPLDGPLLTLVRIE